MECQRFGEFEYFPRSRELRRLGRPASVQDLPLRALEILLQSPGEVVARETFYEALWPNDHSGLLDDNLNSTLRKLRQTLGDSATRPRFIETVPKRGYRLVAAVETIGDNAEQQQPEAPTTYVKWAGLALCALILLGAAVWFLAQNTNTPPPQARTVNAPPDPLAYEYYQQGRFYWHRRTREDLAKAVSLFTQATEISPDYAPSWAGLADAYAVEGFYDYRSPSVAFPLARHAAERALSLDPDNVSAHATLGYAALYYAWDLDAGEAHFLKAIELEPTHSKAHQWYANLLTAAGRWQEAEAEMRRAQQLDPLSTIANAALGWVQYFAGRHQAALRQFDLALELAPEFELALLWRGWTYEAMGDIPAALSALREADRMAEGSAIFRASLARGLALAGETEEARVILQTLAASTSYVPAYEIAKAWLALGDKSQAYVWLDRALAARSHSLVFLNVDPQLVELRSEERFQSLTAALSEPPGSHIRQPAADTRSAPFTVAPELFDPSQPDTLGLSPALGAQTTVVYRGADHQRYYNHGAVLFHYRNHYYLQWQSSARDEDAPDTQVLYSRSRDAITWEAARVLAPAREGAVVTSGGWWSDGTELIAYLNVWPDGLEPRSGFTQYISSKDGLNWTEPAAITHKDGSPVQGIIEQDLDALPDGRVLTSVHRAPGLIATPYFTDDRAGVRDWQAGSMNNLPHEGAVSRELEPSWFRRNDGTIVMVFRDQGSSFRILAATSMDGRRWTQPVLTDMPDSRAKQSAGNLPDGSAYLVNNPSGSKRRIPLVLTLSADGQHFDRALLLRAGGDDLPPMQADGKYKRAGYSYPKSYVHNGSLFVAYAVNKEDIAITRVVLPAAVHN